MTHYKKLQALVLALAASSLLLGVGLASAADLNFSADATVTVNSNSYTVLSGSAATSMLIGATTLTVTVPTGSTFTLTSSSKYFLNNDQMISQQCSASRNTLAITGPVTAVVTPDATSTCVVSNAPSAGGGGGAAAPAITAPTGTSVSVNAGAASTGSSSVTLTLAASGANQMLVSNNETFDGASWETFAATKPWTLASGLGTKTVYAKFRNSVGLVSSAVTDSIEIKTEAAAAADKAAADKAAADKAAADKAATEKAKAKTEVPKAAAETPSAKAPTAKAPTMADVNAVVIPKLPEKPTIADYQAVLSALQQKLTLLVQVKTAEKAATVPAPAAASAPQATAKLARSLGVGSQGDDVRALQEFLKSQGAEIYPEGTVSGYFGGLTRAAVGRFQLKYGIVGNASHPAYGYAGPTTRAKISELLGE